MAISDELWQAETIIRGALNEAEVHIRDWVRDGDRDPNVVVVLAVMRAVRLMPGRDRSPFDPDTFAVNLAEVLPPDVVAPLLAAFAAMRRHGPVGPIFDPPATGWRC